MSYTRKNFLKTVMAGGLGAVFGGVTNIPPAWADKGAKLVTVRRQSLVMGSVASFEVVADSERAGYEAIRRAVRVFRSLDHIFSMYKNDSEMALLGRNAGRRELELSGDALELLRFAKQMHRDSNGRFDVTIEPVLRRWGFRKDPSVTVSGPTAKELRKLERLVGSDKLRLEGNKALLEIKGMAIDTGGIAGGYALDKAMEEIRKCDVSAAFINFAGDIHCFGKPVDDRCWEVVIHDPSADAPFGEPVELRDEALSTSGAYQNRRSDKAHRSWGHLFLPDSARPVEYFESVTAVHASAMAADAWSTAAYLGAVPPRDVRLITQLKQ